MALMPFMIYSFNVGGTKDIIDNYINPPTSGSILTIYYEDENIDPTVYDSKNFGKDGTPLSIYSSLSSAPNSPIKNLKLEVYMTASWTSTSQMTSYSVSGDYTVILSRVAPAATLKTYTVPMQALHPTLTNGGQAVIASMTISASDIENLISTNGGSKGSSYVYNIVYKLPALTLTMNFENGDTDSETAAAPDTAFACIWKDATGTSSITGLSVNFYRTIYQ
jgi:hypothetical protein